VEVEVHIPESVEVADQNMTIHQILRSMWLDSTNGLGKLT
jgi:hypothetical protein